MKGKENTTYSNNLFIYIGKQKEERAQEGVGLLIHEKYEQYIEDVSYIDESLVHVTLSLQSGKTNIVGVYAPDISKPTEVRETFFNKLQNIINSIPNREKVLMLGYFNTKRGNEPIPGIMQKYNEETNDNGELLIHTSVCSKRNENK